MNQLRIEVTRGPLVESVHRVSAAVVDRHGALVAAAGTPELVTYWRSAAKPFQALPLLLDGVVDRFGLTPEELAIASASHSSEPLHLEVVDRFLAKIGVEESALACGPHPPLGADIARAVIRDGTVMTPRWSNCSGKHTGMLALARHHGWPTVGYERLGHPVQERIVAEVERWTGLPRAALVLSTDGCNTTCFGLGLDAMARAYARFTTTQDAEPRRLWRALTDHPDLIAGTGRLCTDLSRAWPGEIFAKVGAEGVYSAGLLSHGVGLALKVEDGDFRTAGIALLAVIRQVLEGADDGPALDRLATLGDHAEFPVRTTRDGLVGTTRAQGRLEFFDTTRRAFG